MMHSSQEKAKPTTITIHKLEGHHPTHISFQLVDSKTIGSIRKTLLLHSKLTLIGNNKKKEGENKVAKP